MITAARRAARSAFWISTLFTVLVPVEQDLRAARSVFLISRTKHHCDCQCSTILAIR
jgi:hypothetical protein